MISIKNLKGGRKGSGAADVAHYCAHERDDHETGYYRAGGAPSFWHGQGAGTLGLAGPVDRETFVRAIEGRLPDGVDIAPRGHVDHRRLGVDLTISAPKSVSLMALAGGDDRILDAHDRAVQAALNLVEREILVARRGKGGIQVEHTGALLAAVCRHEDSRPVNGHADLQIHSHCILVNATQRAGSIWSALDLQFGERSVLMHLADAVYKSELATAVQRLGYDLRRTPDGFELAQITDEQIQHFSQRARQIDAALAARGLSRATAAPPNAPRPTTPPARTRNRSTGRPNAGPGGRRPAQLVSSWRSRTQNRDSRSIRTWPPKRYRAASGTSRNARPCSRATPSG